MFLLHESGENMYIIIIYYTCNPLYRCLVFHIVNSYIATCLVIKTQLPNYSFKRTEVIPYHGQVINISPSYLPVNNLLFKNILILFFCVFVLTIIKQNLKIKIFNDIISNVNFVHKNDN